MAYDIQLYGIDAGGTGEAFGVASGPGDQRPKPARRLPLRKRLRQNPLQKLAYSQKRAHKEREWRDSLMENDTELMHERRCCPNRRLKGILVKRDRQVPGEVIRPTGRRVRFNKVRQMKLVYINSSKWNWNHSIDRNADVSGPENAQLLVLWTVS